MPNNWKKYKLGDSGIDILDGDRGKNYPSQNEFYKKEYCLFLSTRNVTLSGFQFDDCQFITKEKDLQLRKGKLQRNDIVITTRGTIGNIGFYNENIAFENIRINSGMVILRFLNKEYLPEFYHHFFKSKTFSDQVSNYVSGSAQPQLPIKDLKCIEVPMPPLNEQQAIAEILSSIDDKIELNLQTNKTLEEMANALYKHWFVDFGPFQKGKFVESELGLIPEGWEISRLENVVDIGSSKRIFLNEYVSSGIPFYRGKEIIELSKNNSINTELFINVDKFEDIKARFGAPKEGDILLTSVGTIGKSYLIGADEIFYFKDGNLTWIKNYLSYLKPHFVFQWLNSVETLEQIQSIKIGSTQEAITIQGIRSLKIIVPPKSIHDEVEIKIREYRNLIKSNNSENDALKQTRDYLLPKLISGEIRVKDAAKKVKEVL